MTCNLEIVYDDERWATILTEAEEDCVTYLKNNSSNLIGKLAVDVGIGTSFFYKELKDIFKRIDGLTVIDLEINLAKQISGFSDEEYRLLKVNKHNVEELEANLKDKYSAIVDVNLKMFGCCQTHWEDYFLSIVQLLCKDGVLLSHTIGFGCYKDSLCSELTIPELEALILRSPRLLEMEVIPSSLIKDQSLIIIRALDD